MRRSYSWWLALALLATANASRADSPLAGTPWQLVAFTSTRDSKPAPQNLTKFTLTFQTDGSVAIGTDCNQGRGTWKSSSGTQLTIASVSSTLMACLHETYGDQFLRDLSSVAGYTIIGDHLTLALENAAGTYEFAPIEPLSS